MHLYHLTLQRATAVHHAFFGNFTGTDLAPELILARAAQMELWRVMDDGALRLVYHQEMFGIIRSLSTFRVVGVDRDFLAVGSDSGKIVFVEYSVEEDRFNTFDIQTYGKSGCRRVIAGQHLAMDPRGRAFILAASERQKLAYRI